MSVFKKLAKLEAENVTLRNMLRRMERKIDAIMESQLDSEEIEDIQYPEEEKVPALSGEEELPYNVRELRQPSTLPIPGGPDNLEIGPVLGLPEPVHKDTLKAPEAKGVGDGAPANPLIPQKPKPNPPDQDPDKEPFEGYDKATVGDILKRAKDMTDEQRRQILRYERTHQKRPTLIEALVNWNS